MVIRLHIEIWEIVKSSTKRQDGEKGWVGGGRGLEASGFYGMFGCVSVVAVEGVCVRDCRGLQLCIVGIVG
jgi:hypothetical protein